MKLKAIITGSKVHDVGYRVMLVNKALSLGINNFNAFNTFLDEKQAVFAIIEGDEDTLGEFNSYVNTVKPDEAEVENICFEEYKNTVPPIERVMQAFQMEQWGKGIPILLKMLDQQDSMLKKQDSMLDKQDSMLDKQETTIGILKSVNEDTSHIRKDTSKIPDIADNTLLIPAMKEDTFEIKSNTREVVDKLQNKYDEISREIVEIKVTLARIQAKVFA